MEICENYESSKEFYEYLHQLLPHIESFSLDKIPENSTFIGAAGFEDRCFSFIDQFEQHKKKFSNTIGIEYRPINNKNRTKEFKDKINNITLKNVFWLIYNRFDPEEFCNDFVRTKKDIWETANVVIDISGMSKFLIIVILDLLDEYEGNVHIIYSEAEIYHPTKEKVEEMKKKLPESIPSFLTKDVFKIVTTKSLSSIAMQGSPLLSIAFPTFNSRELEALLSGFTPQYLIKIEGIPHEMDNRWRLDAIHDINTPIDKSFSLNIKEIIHENVTTFNYIELVRILDKIYKTYRYSHKIIIAPTGSKLQTLGVFIFKQMHPEIQIVYPVTKDFDEEYSEGCTRIWHIPIFNFFDFMKKLNEHRRYHVDSLRDKIEIDKNKRIKILHLSDIHLGTISDAHKYIIQLETDLIKNLKISELDYLVISGDIASVSTMEEYEAAAEMICNLSRKFKLDSNRIIIVPGNHDINWEISKKAFIFCPKDKLPNPLPEGRYIPAGDVGALLRDDGLYQKRFVNFGEHFYEKVASNQYPLEYDKQGILHIYQDDRILFLALNSCWEIDHYKLNSASINMDALSNALDQLMDNKYDGWLKIALWHHPVTGPEMMKNVDFLQLLAVHGFQICMHGHIHEAIDGYHKYDDKRGINIVGAGTFGAPKREQTTGIPLQYNLLVYDPERHEITVETRKKEKPDGAWSADARWVDSNDPKPRYTINLK
ncbi:MAG: metallophosphoesterase [Candidatus Methanoperedens sp.]